MISHSPGSVVNGGVIKLFLWAQISPLDRTMSLLVDKLIYSVRSIIIIQYKYFKKPGQP
jgi:hypothetical protein